MSVKARSGLVTKQYIGALRLRGSLTVVPVVALSILVVGSSGLRVIKKGGG